MNETEYMSFLIKDYNFFFTFFKNDNLWNKISNSIKEWFHSELAYKRKYLKTKSKAHEGKIKTYFHNNEISKEIPFLYLYISNINWFCS